AEHDRHRGLLDEQRQRYIRQSMKEIIDDLGERYQLPDTQAKGLKQERNGNGNGHGDHPEPEHRASALCLPARDEADEIVAMMLSQVLEQAGCPAKYIPVAALASEMVETVQQQDARVVCISALPPSALAHARYLCKRVRVKSKDIPLVIGLWGTRVEAKKAMSRLACGEGDKVVRSLREARAEIGPVGAMDSLEATAKEEVPVTP